MVPRLHEIAVDARALWLAIALSGITALLVGVLPAITLSRIDHVQDIGFRGAGGQGGPLRGDTRLRSLLVAGRVAMATTLLIGAGLLMHSLPCSFPPEASPPHRRPKLRTYTCLRRQEPPSIGRDKVKRAIIDYGSDR